MRKAKAEANCTAAEEEQGCSAFGGRRRPFTEPFLVEAFVQILVSSCLRHFLQAQLVLHGLFGVARAAEACGPCERWK